MVVCQLRKWDRKGYLKSRPRLVSSTTSAGKVVDLAELDTKNNQTLVFDASGMKGFGGAERKIAISYADMAGVVWMAPEIERKVRMKAASFDRLIIERFDGTSVVIEGIGQAVFPLLRAFDWIGKQNRAKRLEESSRAG